METQLSLQNKFLFIENIEKKISLFVYHGLMIYIDAKAKCRRLNILTCNGTLQQVFIGVYRLEIQSVMLVFSTQICELLSL